MDDIDAALLSRLHFKFHYEDLGVEQRLALWKSFLGVVEVLDEEELRILSRDYDLNGREVSNVCFYTT